MKLKLPNKFLTPFLHFFKHEAASGILLLICAVIAVLIANSSFASEYNHFLHTYITIGYKDFSISMSILHWINDGLMAIFFFVVGMEIKRELIVGELKSIKKTILPIAAAFGGMVVPAIIYAMLNFNELTITGWGIPMATDIAFALGILSLVGRKKAPKGIVVFLTALAIVDDLGAIIVIAIFYTSQVSLLALGIAIFVTIALMLANKFKVDSVFVFIVLGFILWISLLKSGIHSTIAGVVLGMTIPGTRNIEEFKTTMLYKLEHAVTPWSAFLIMPLFALANSGVAIDLGSFSKTIATPLSLGIILGLFIGKQVGIFGVSYILVKLNIAKLPTGVTRKHLYGASVLGGIGFTMSLFVSSLSFSNEALLATAKVSILSASILSAILGVLILNSIKSRN